MRSTPNVKGLRDSISDWLLKSSIRLHNGPNKGAILGWLSPIEQEHYIYPEAAGYYLTTMRFMMNACTVRANRAAACLTTTFEWFERHVSDRGIPPTRMYLTGTGDDWRNHAIFFFDCAMAIRGLVAAADVVSRARVSPVVRPYISAIHKMYSSGVIVPYIFQGGPNPLPERWSTRCWVHHLKAIAALEICRRKSWVCEIPDCVLSTLSLWRRVINRLPHQGTDLHPWLYGIEGLLLIGLLRRDRTCTDEAFEAFQHVCSISLDGSLPDRVGDLDGRAVRSDVQAQALRLAAAFSLIGYMPTLRYVNSLIASLTRYISANGGVMFRLPVIAQIPHANSWCSMFAYQALAFLDSGRSTSLNSTALELLA